MLNGIPTIMPAGIYKIHNKCTNKCYVGSTKNFESRWKQHLSNLQNQKHSSIKLQRSYNKHGIDAFEFEVIEELPYERTIIIQREDYWISQLNSKQNGYNIADASFGDQLTHHPNRLDIISRIKATSIRNMQSMTTEQRKLKFGRHGPDNGMYGRKHTDAAKERISQANTGNEYSKGKLRSDQTKQILSDIAKTRIGDKNPFYGKNHSNETKRKIGNANLGNNPVNRLQYSISGKIYNGLDSAERGTGIKRSTIRHRCISQNKKYDEYFIIRPCQL